MIVTEDGIQGREISRGFRRVSSDGKGGAGAVSAVAVGA